ncbi:MAG: ATP-binding protein [Acidobacteriota bacterium]|nr:ATP-binding protein [Acidobacteriota bacterium]
MFHSVRARLTLWYTAILALVLVTFSVISYALLARTIRAATDSSLADTAHEFAAAFSNEGSGADVHLDFRFSDREIFVFTPSGQIITSTRSRMTGTERQQLAKVVARGFQGFRTNGGVRIYATPINVIGNHYTVVVAQSLDQQNDRLEGAAQAVFFGIPLALLLAAGGGYIMARKSLAPVTKMSLEARHIGAETLDERIAVVNERDELGFLAMTLNDLLERLQRAFASQRRFMADASHELRTPISILQGEADVALSRPDRSAADYRTSIEIMGKAALKLTRIVQDLFLLARTDAGTYPISKSRFYLDEVVAECVRVMRSVAVAKRIELTCDSPSDLVVVADEELIQRLILNLVDNAVKFTGESGRVSVRVAREAGTYVVRVTDNGPGIPAEDQAHLFERFFRGNRSRGLRSVIGRAASGAGLGLSIARWIAEVHAGRLVLESSDALGTTFAVNLPIDPPEFHVESEPCTPGASDSAAGLRR